MILIDIHEPHRVEQYFRGLPVRRVYLEKGDYLFDSVAIERKTLSDFFSSMKTGRLFYQIKMMNATYNRAYLIIEGLFDFSYVQNINYLYSLLQDIIIDMDVHVIFTKDLEDSVNAIKRIYYSNNGYTRFSKKENLSLFAIKLLTGLSYRKIEKIFSEHSTVRVLSHARELNIKGVGNKSKERIRIFLDKKIL